MDPKFRDNYYVGRRSGATITYANTSFTTTGLATLVTPTTGKRLRVFAIRVQAYVTTVLASATVGDPLLVCDNAIDTPVIDFRLGPNATATRAAQGGYVVAANDAVTVHYGWAEEDFGLAGIKLGAVNNALKVGLANTITTGVIAVRGYIIHVSE